MLQATVVIVAVGPRHRAVGRITTAVRVLVIHVAERESGGLHSGVVGRLFAGSVAISHALASTPSPISNVGSEAG